MGEPQTFGRYQLLEMAGSGGMAQVHLARQLGPQGFVKPCVLKRIAPHHRGDQAVRRMFLEEARISALLNHPNVVQTFDYGEVDDVPYMAMELVDGVNLAQLCRTLSKAERWLPLQPAVEIVQQVLEALDYAHRLADLDGRPLALVHRDVSPQNILLSRQGTVKLADFGIARHTARETHTMGPNAKGKPGYMAPEQAMGGAVDGRADIFAVGVVLAELISARRVLPGGDRVAGVTEIEPRIRQLCALRREAPPELSELCVRLASLDMGRRPQTARDALTFLDKATARVPASLRLQDFLRSVADTYLTHEGRGEAPTELAPSHLPAPPEASASDLALRSREWEPSEGPEGGTQSVYERGWPADYMPDAPPAPLRVPPPVAPAPEASAPTDPAAPAGDPRNPAADLELVPHSSSVDAMQFFQAQVSGDVEKQYSSDDERRAAEAERQRQRRLPYRATRSSGAGVPAASRSTDLPLPVFADQGAASGGDPPQKKGMLGFEDPALEKALSTISSDGTPKPGQAAPKKRFSLPPVVPLLGAGLLVGAAAIGVLATISPGEEADAPAVAETATLTITSEPPGATVFLDGRDTHERTPVTLPDLATDRPIDVAVRRDGYLASPVSASLQLTGGKRTQAQFTLRRGRAYRVVTEPPDAIVTVNGHRLSEVSPVLIPVVPFGLTATVTAELEGHMPAKVVITSAVDTATTVRMPLTPGKMIEISSTPPGALVELDGARLGRTPLYDLLVPAEERFTVKMRLAGFRPWRKRLHGKRMDGTPVVAELDPLPFLALPWTKAEKARARSLDRDHARTARRVTQLEAKLREAERRQTLVESSINASVGDLAEVQRNSDNLRQALNDAQSDVADLEAQMDSLRQQLLLRMDDES